MHSPANPTSLTSHTPAKLEDSGTENLVDLWDSKSCEALQTPILQGRILEAIFSLECSGLLSALPNTSENPRNGVLYCSQ